MTGTRKNKGGHFWHTADYLKERGDTAKQNRGFFRSEPLRPAEAESANKTDQEDKQKARRLHTRALGNAPKWWTNTDDQYHHATINAYSSLEVYFFLTIKPKRRAFIDEGTVLQHVLKSNEPVSERGASALGWSVLITFISVGICTLKCLAFLVGTIFCKRNLCIKILRILKEYKNALYLFLPDKFGILVLLSRPVNSTPINLQRHLLQCT